MGSLINENIRYYKANDPYYFAVDNLPLRDLVQNDKNLEEAILALSPPNVVEMSQLRELAKKVKNRIRKLRIPKAPTLTVVGREGFDDLLPYVSGADGNVYVTPGVFSARTNKTPEMANGLTEKDAEPGTVVVGETFNAYRQRNLDLGYPARFESFQFKPNADGSDKAITIPRFSEGDFIFSGIGSSGVPIWRVDLIGIAGTNDPHLFVIQGAGFGTYGGLRMAETDKGYMAVPEEDNDPDNAKHATHKHKFDFETGENVAAAIPLPDDLYNAAGRIINDVIVPGEPSDLQFSIPLAYVLVNAGHEEGTALLDSQVMDIRPFFRSAELTLDERQAIAVADPPANIVNPYATKAQIDSLTADLDAVRASIPEVPTLPGNFNLFGKILFEYGAPAPGHSYRTIPVELGNGHWLALINFTANGHVNGANHNFGVFRSDTGAILTQPGTGTNASLSMHRNQDDDCNAMHAIPFKVAGSTASNSRLFVGVSTSTGSTNKWSTGGNHIILYSVIYLKLGGFDNVPNGLAY